MELAPIAEAKPIFEAKPQRSLLREGGESSHDGDGLFCLTALIWRCLGVGAWVWHDGYVHVFRVVLFSESVVLSCGEAILSVGLAQSDLKSDCCEYQDLQSANRISNAYIHCGRIENPPERDWLLRFTQVPVPVTTVPRCLSP